MFCCIPTESWRTLLVRFGQRVLELRKEQGYSQENFARVCELDRTYVGGIERGERNCPCEILSGSQRHSRSAWPN
nr:helix-turn-helix transcriptional regulator [Gimesia benthica]